MLGELNGTTGEEFNDRVADLFEHNSAFRVRRRVGKFGSLKVSGPQGDLGDLDVLVADLERRELLVIECKDLAIARTPNELINEVENLVRGKATHPSIVERHKRRLNWVRTHLREVLDWLDVPSRGKWKVTGLIVVDQGLFTPYIETSDLPIHSLDELRESLMG